MTDMHQSSCSPINILLEKSAAEAEAHITSHSMAKPSLFIAIVRPLRRNFILAISSRPPYTLRKNSRYYKSNCAWEHMFCFHCC